MRHQGTQHSEKGFTLFELVVTLTVLAIVLMGTIPLAHNSVVRQRELRLRETLRMMRNAIDEFKRDTVGACPAGAVTSGDPTRQGRLPNNTPADPRSRVVIDDFRIARAGVVCPLSDQSLDPRFGTRHRGAIGVSEDSDALVIVLSEERGEMRVVEGGVISEPLDSPGLARRIYAWIDRPPPAAREPAVASGSRVDMRAEEVR